MSLATVCITYKINQTFDQFELYDSMHYIFMFFHLYILIQSYDVNISIWEDNVNSLMTDRLLNRLSTIND